MPELFYEWITPTGVLLLVGGIVWGVQLNLSVMMLIRRDAEKQKQIEQAERSLHSVSKDLVRVSTILDRLTHDIERLENKA